MQYVLLSPANSLLAISSSYSNMICCEKTDITMKSVTGLCACQCGEKTSIAIRTSRRDGDVKGEPRRFVRGHHARKSFIEYIEEDRGFETPCWIWQKAKSKDGYGGIWENGKMQAAYAVYYERKLGKPAPGLEFHHRCRVRICVNPDHLELKSSEDHKRFHLSEAVEAAKRYFSNVTHCPHGHEFTRDNVYRNPKTGHRSCAACRKIRNDALTVRRQKARRAN